MIRLPNPVFAAELFASSLRRRGYPNAEAWPQYCLDWERGDDRTLTYTIVVYMGECEPEPEKPVRRWGAWLPRFWRRK